MLYYSSLTDICVICADLTFPEKGDQFYLVFTEYYNIS